MKRKLSDSQIIELLVKRLDEKLQAKENQMINTAETRLFVSGELYALNALKMTYEFLKNYEYED